MMHPTAFRLACIGAVLGLAATPAVAQQGDASDLAKKLANPVASLISVPAQFNYDRGFGADDDGNRTELKIQPVIPISISEDWNVISRTIVPIIRQKDVVPDEGLQFGLGAATQSLFFSPKAPTDSGLIWGAGPVFLLPTSTDNLAGDQWGAGVTAVALRQSGPWTVGALGNHIWSVADQGDGDISATFLQPFVSYTTSTATSFTLNTESSYDWESEQWSVPINAVVSQIVKIGGQPVQFGVGARYWAVSPEGGAEGWGARFQITLLFPK